MKNSEYRNSAGYHVFTILFYLSILASVIINTGCWQSDSKDEKAGCSLNEAYWEAAE